MFVGEDFPCSLKNWESFTERENFPAQGNIFPFWELFPATCKNAEKRQTRTNPEIFEKLPVSADKGIHLQGSPKILTWEFEKNIPPKTFEGKYSPDNLEGNIPSEMFVREDFPCSLNNWLGFTECENFPVQGNIFPKVNIFPFW